MEPLICPQCGGKITSYAPGQRFTTCSYCSTTFLIEENKQTPTPAAPVYEPYKYSGPKPQLFVVIIGAVIAVMVGVLLIGLAASKKGIASPPRTGGFFPSSPTPKVTPVPTPNPNILEFGGTGTGEGQFKDANSITVDKQGRIYVSDDTLRVQQFDAGGNFLKAIQVPAKTGNYDHARTIDKIAAGDDGKLYVAVGGVIEVFGEKSTKFDRVIEMAPDYIQDFALKSDGGMDIIYDNDRIETLIVVTKTGTITKEIAGFHTKALDAAISPRDTAIAAIRLAVDGTGNIFSVYAFGDLGSYQISSNNDELMVASYSPAGKFISKFVQSMNSCGIETDSRGRVYLSESDRLNLYTNTGQPAGTITLLDGIHAFTIDKDGFVFALLGDRVVKRPPVE